VSSTLLQPARRRSRTHDLSNASESKVFNPFNDSGPRFKLVGSASWGAAGPLHGSRSHRRCRCADVSDREACERARARGLGAIVAHRDSQGLLRRLEPKWGALAWETSSASPTRAPALSPMARACRREHRCRRDRRCRHRLCRSTAVPIEPGRAGGPPIESGRVVIRVLPGCSITRCDHETPHPGSDP
jgi:hypothetical protein